MVGIDIFLKIWKSKGCKSDQCTEQRKPTGTMKKNQQLLKKENIIMILYWTLKCKIVKYNNIIIPLL